MRTSFRSTARYSAIHILLLALLFSMAEGKQFVVKSTADAGAHSLRWALLQANASPGPDVISFEIPGDGPHSIVPASPLPPLTDPAGTVIDGLSQPGSTLGDHPPATLELRIVLDGVHAGAAPGLWLQSPQNLIQGLVITRFAKDGIRLQGKEDVHHNTVRNCIVGLDPAGTDARGNCMEEGDIRCAGIRLAASAEYPGSLHDNSILTCIVSGNAGDGILLKDTEGAQVRKNTISGNFIGSTRSGDVPRGNDRDGIQISGGCALNTISANLIGGNGSDGIHIIGDATRGALAHANSITRNNIGVTIKHHAMGNKLNGVNLGGREYGSEGGFASKNIVSSNVIAANGRSGIVVREHESSANNADGNRLTQNSIYMNGRIGIDLGDDGVTMNDLADHDVGPNQNRNTPVILSAEVNGGLALLRGNVDLGSLPREAVVEVYKTHAAPMLRQHETLYLGAVMPDADGNWAYSCNGGVLAGDSVTAIVVDSDGNTSEFARARKVTRGDAVEVEDNKEIAEQNRIKENPNATIASMMQDKANGSVIFTIDVEKPCWSVLEIYTENDQLVSTVLNRWMPAGRHTITWDGNNWKGSEVPPGSYTCKFDADGVRQTTTLARRLSGASQ
ncbi:right-handed parallel beta-helix repeat-containing protein [bacterium]|nr:right-handed parallel beta-helix repeat-containing protein [bacterium]